MTMRDYHIVMTLDSTFLRGGIATIRSIAAQSSVPLTFWVIQRGLSDEEWSLLTNAAGRHRLHPVAATTERLPLYGAGSPSVYDRLFLTDLVPSALRYVLYVDSDVISLGDISAIWDWVDLDHPLCAVQDYFWRNGPRNDMTRYFNSGVFIADLSYWRRERVKDRAVAYVRSTHCRFWDQDALNHVFEDEWREIDPIWNVFHFDEVGLQDRAPLSPGHTAWFWERLQDDAMMLHYVTGLKPWREGYPGGRNYERFAKWI